MPIVTIQSPTGQSFQIEAPEGATDDQILRFAKSQGLFDEQQQPPQAQAEAPRELGAGEQEDGFLKNASDVAMEAISSINRVGAGAIDFLIPDTINAVLELAGVDERVPTLAGAGVGQGGFMEPGLSRDIVQAGSEAAAMGLGGGGALRSAAQRISPEVQTMGANLMRQLGAGTAKGDIALGGLSGVGSAVGREVGGDTGSLAGSLLAPLAGVSGTVALKTLGKKGYQMLANNISKMSDDGASSLLAEAMVREGLSPEDVTKRIAELGPEAIPADVGLNFSRLLRTASNKIPRIEGRAAQVLSERGAGQGTRLLKAMDDTTGTSSLTVDGEIARLNQVMRPQIDELYAQARGQSMVIPKRLGKMLEAKKGSLGKARKAAEKRLADKRLMGDEITNVSIIDATKQELDDQIGKAIRAGENNKARDLVRLKNMMVDEADKAIPSYKEARNLFAGKAELENAAASGEMFLKIKPRDMQQLTKSMGDSERQMFKLGAKQAILDKIDDLSTSRDAAKALFGKNGDVKKLRYLFDDEAAFNRFSDTLKRETDFVLTRRAAQANSTTAKQMSDEMNAMQTLEDAFNAISNPVGAANTLGRIAGKLSAKRGSEAFTQALEEAGDILLTKGMDPDKIQAMLRNGSAKQIEDALRNSLKQELRAPRVAPITSGAALSLQSDPDRTQ